MERRSVLKAAAVLALATTYSSAYDNSKIVNTMKMKIKDPAHPTDFELKHTPQITLSALDEKGYITVDVTVGEKGIIHPSTEDHWIYKLELYADGKKVGSLDLEPVTSRGYLGAKVLYKGLKELRAVSYCNLHGTWENTHKV
ncbi:desulfoferrodoxin family protein [Sulfurospirillum sp. 1612]|uniref:desulfoferrodoxin family protein n=1 Tax=Sulfurospirillum sp. 1612 TaxID=3094835 RepID=UPI002F949CAB